MKIIDVSTFRFRRNPAFDYSLFDPVNEAEWLRLEAVLGKDAVYALIRQEVLSNPQPYLTLEIGRTKEGYAVLYTGHPTPSGSGWFAGVAWTKKGEEQYRTHAKHRVEALQSGDGTIVVILKPKKGPRHQSPNR